MNKTPVLRILCHLSLCLAFFGFIGAVVVAFANKSPAATTDAFRTGFLLLALAPALIAILLLVIFASLRTNDSVAEAWVVSNAAFISLAPSAVLLPGAYWHVHVLLGLLVVNRVVIEMRRSTLVKRGILVPIPVASSRDSNTKREARVDYNYPAERAAHSLADLAGMEELKGQLIAAVKEARYRPSNAKNGDTNTLRAKCRNGILLSGEPGNGKTVFAEGVAGTLKLPIIKMSFGNVSSHWLHATTGNVVTLFSDARAQAPCVLFLDEVDSVIPSREHQNFTSEEGPKTTNQILTELVATRGTGVVIIMATNFPERLDTAAVREGRVDFKITVPPPDADARRAIIDSVLAETATRIDCDYDATVQAVKRWEGFSAARIHAVIDEALRRSAKNGVCDMVYSDLQSAMRAMQGKIGVRLPENTPGLDQLFMPAQQKDALMGVAKRMIDIEEVERLGGTVPSGLLLAGKPGTGKTMVVRSLAKTTEWPLLTSSGADLMADSKNIDQLIIQARNARPVIVFIDEADDVFSDRRAGNTYSASITNKLLTAMDGVKGRAADILWVAAVNAVETMDPAALRGGRFTEKIWFENPDAEVAQNIIAQWMAGSRAKFDPMLTPVAIARSLDGESPANINAVLQQAVNTMVARKLIGKGEEQVGFEDIEAARLAILA